MNPQSFWLSVLLIVVAALSHADYYVAQDGQTPVNPFTSWATAASNIQVAVTSAPAGGTVWIRAGTYTNTGTDVVSINKSLNLRSETGNPDDVKIDGQAARRGLYVVMTTPGNVWIDGITVTNGRVTSSCGGGIYIKHATIMSGTAMVQRCKIAGNYAAKGDGGGMFSHGQSNTAFHTIVSDCAIFGNKQESGASWIAETGVAGGYGGGASFWRTRLTMQDCIVSNNVDVGGANWDQASRGGGLYLFQLSANSVIRRCSVVKNNAPDSKGDINNSGSGLSIKGTTGNPVLIENSVFQNNGGAGYAGGIANVGGDVIIRGSLISHNTCGGYGSGILHLSGTTILESSTVASNTLSAGNYAEGVRVGNASTSAGSVSVTNSIIYNNLGGNLGMNAGTLIVSYSCSTPLPGGTGNTAADPKFVSLAGGDFRLQSNSPCINTGTNQTWMTGAMDLANKPRLDWKNSLVDMGAYEYVPPRPSGTVMMVR